jgi:hypothetical protein
MKNYKSGIFATATMVALVAVLLAASFLVIGCGLSTEDLAKEVQSTYEENWDEQGLGLTITKDLQLVKKSKTEYTGLMTVSLDGETEQVTVNVVYDGKSFSSQIEGW